MPAKEKTMNDAQTIEAGNSLPPPLGSRIERIMEDLLDIEYRSGCSARVQDMVHRAIGYLESARYANAPREVRETR